MTRRGFITYAANRRVSTGATFGFIARLSNDPARNFRKLFQRPIPARNVASPRQEFGGVCASDGQVALHDPRIAEELSHDDGLPRQKESADRSLTDA